MLEKTLESPLDCKEIQPVNPIFIGRTVADAEALILWPPDVKSWLTGKNPDAGKDWGQEEKGAAEDETVRLSGLECEQTLGDSGGQRSWRAAVHGVSKSQTWLSDWTAPPPTKSCWVSFKCIESGSVVWTCVYWGVCVCVCARCSFLPLGGDNDCMAADFFLKTVRVRGRGTFVNCWKNKKQKTHNRLHRILHTLKISCRDEEEIKTFSEEN